MKNNETHQIELQRGPDKIPREKPTSRLSTAVTTTIGNFENFQHEPYDSPFLRTYNFFSFQTIKHLFFLPIVVFEKITDAEA